MRPGFLPRLEVACVVAISTVHTQGIRHVHHQRVGVLRLLGRCTVGVGAHTCHRLIAIDPDRQSVFQERRERIKRQRRQPSFFGGNVLARQITQQAVRVLAVFGCIPNLGGYVVATVAGVTSHTRVRHVGLPVLIDFLGHFNHASGHHLGVHAVICKVLNVVAVSTALIRCDPLRDGRHLTVELAHTQISQNLHVLINLAGFGTVC